VSISIAKKEANLRMRRLEAGDAGTAAQKKAAGMNRPPLLPRASPGAPLSPAYYLNCQARTYWIS
jgi:hypothetical protein